MKWSNAIPLFEYIRSPSTSGIYVIGKKKDDKIPIIPNDAYDPYLGTWPDNFSGLYVGISESNKTGIRGRLRSHYKGRGSKSVAGRLASGDELYFIFSEGVEKIKYEAPLILLKTNFIFQDNVRCEMHRSMRRVAKAIRGEMSQYERDRYDNLDMGEHGEGM